MPLQSRVDPFGQLFADASRGLFMGNRGGRFHRDDRSLGSRRWASRQWICCRLAFRDRHREVWGAGYTELFFLDEPTALAAGHRPCFECRRHDAQAFAAAFGAAAGLAHPASASDMDLALHVERLAGRVKRRHRLAIDDLPGGAVIAAASETGAVFAVLGRSVLRWTPTGYASPQPRPRGVIADVLTPPSILAALGTGYRPQWHPSASAQS